MTDNRDREPFSDDQLSLFLHNNELDQASTTLYLNKDKVMRGTYTVAK